jgi:hypothetical protein
MFGDKAMTKSDTSLPSGDLSEADIRFFLEKKLQDLQCPVCRGEDFEVMYGDGAKFVRLHCDAISQTSSSIPELHALALSCYDCGHILLFAIPRVRRLIKTLKSEAGNGDL